MSRFFYTATQRHNEDVTLTGDDARHLSRVLRASPGDAVELCNESGQCQAAQITFVGKESVTCRLASLLPDRESGVRVTLAFALLKGEKTDFVLQKATELGVSAFIPFSSTRCVARIDKKARDKLVRWDKIVRSAAGQSLRNRVPVISPPLDWPQLLTEFQNYQRIVFFWEGEGDKPLAPVLKGVLPGENILLITGPEGGFSREEAEEAMASGANAVTLGPRILRAETAAVVSVAVALYEAGEMGGR
ncbi:MAG: 16S rRNA (uracil(1498)-N(3))-methyltransferase [Clostridiales bacterium]|jgi:16S rRNA (uracil1498-N3)-methyltransferase|nr:16S rRNA (uracil(1498)-N(3))-methyltransferase [Clostridiales bacterium]